MILYYAIGGGLGHLVRARAVLHTLSVSDRAAVVTASRFAADTRVVGDVPVIRVPEALDGDRAALRRWLADLVAGLQPERLVVDAFPAGVLGELRDPGVPVDHVARLRAVATLRATAGRAAAADRDHVRGRAAPRRPPLRPRGRERADGPARARRSAGAGARRRGRGGAGRARRAGRTKCARCARWLPAPGTPCVWRGRAARTSTSTRHRRCSGPPAAIVTGAGFNAMRQAEPYRERHRYLPFPRPLDDQVARAELARRARPLDDQRADGSAWATGSASPERWLQAIQPYSQPPATSVATYRPVTEPLTRPSPS